MDIDSALNQMRQKHAPTEGDRERVHAALAAALAVSGAAGLVHVATTTGLKGAGLKGTALALPMWVKGSIAIGSLMAAVGGYHGLSAYRNSKETAATVQQFAPLAPAAQGASANTDGHVESRREPTLERQSNQAAAGEVTAPTAKHVDERTSTSKSRAAHRALASATAASVTAASVTTTSLAELRLIGEASRALREGRTEEARSALAEHQRQYADTALAQERGALELLARCAESNSLETRRAAESFLRVSPKSPMAGSIRRECLK